jgi:hypothetical protein
MQTIRAELQVMETIAEAMATLPEDARHRVARWIADSFGKDAVSAELLDIDTIDAEPAQTAPTDVLTAPSAAPRREPGLDVDDLGEFFEAEPAPQQAPKQEGSVVGMIHALAEDVRRLARDWQSA